MAWSEVLDERAFSVGFAPQASGINTAGSSWTWIDCEMPQVSYDAAQTDTQRSRRARGAGTRRLTGKVWPRVAIRFPMVGQLSAYDYTADTPGLKGANGLLDFLGGNASIAYQATGISPSDGNTITLATSQGKLGCLIAGVEASGSVAAMGFPTAIGSGGPYTTQLFEDLKAQPGTGIARIPTYTMYPSTTAPSPLTIRVCGESASFDKRYVGCVLNRASLSFDADWRPYWNVEFTAYGGETREDASGGLQTITECLAIEPLVSRGGARYVIGSNVLTALADGTVDADGTCDLRDFEMSWEFPHYVATKPTGTEGVSEVLVRSPIITAGFSLPDISNFVVSSAQMGEAAWRNLTDISVSLYMGDTPGQIAAFNLPRMGPTAYPEAIMVEGVRHRRYQLEAMAYTGDEASTNGGNKPLRVSLG